MLHVNTHRLKRSASVFALKADTNDPKAVLAELQKGFKEFKDQHELQLKEVKDGIKDVVRTEQVEKINAEIGKLQKILDDSVKKIAGMQVGAGGDDKRSPEQREHSKVFNTYFRKGKEEGLREAEVKASASTLSDPDGGYTVPEEVEGTIDRILENTSPMRQLARVQSISTNLYKKLITTQGAEAGWVGETDARPETDTPRLSELQFPVFEMYANPAATQTLLDDSAIDIAGWLGDEVSLEFADMEGAAFTTGNGSNQPRGFLSYTPVANASWSWGNVGFIVSGAAADFHATLPGDALIDLVYALRSGFRQNGVFQANDMTIAKMRKFKDGQNNYLWQPSIQVGTPSMFLGYPLQSNDYMPDVGAGAFAVAFADWKRAYLILDRIGIRVLRDPYTNKPYVHFYTTKRVGGGISNFQAIKLLKISA